MINVSVFFFPFVVVEAKVYILCAIDKCTSCESMLVLFTFSVPVFIAVHTQARLSMPARL